jgi:mannosyltransferase
MVDLGVDYYLHGRVPLDQVFVTWTAQQNGSYYATLCAAPASCLASAPQRIWLAVEYPVNVLLPWQSAEQAALLARYRVVHIYHRSDIQVSLLERIG